MGGLGGVTAIIATGPIWLPNERAREIAWCLVGVVGVVVVAVFVVDILLHLSFVCLCVCARAHLRGF